MLTNQSRQAVGAVLVICAAVCLTATSVAVVLNLSDTQKQITLFLCFWSTMVIVFLVWKMTCEPITPYDLMLQARRQLFPKDFATLAKTMESKRIVYEQSNWGRKVAYLLFLSVGFLCLGGVLLTTAMIFLKPLTREDVTAAWVLILILLTLSIPCFGLAISLRYAMQEQKNQEFDKFVREIREEFES